MTNLEDALVAVDAGADAVGFVFYEKSPRCVTVEVAREIVEKLPDSVEKVGIFVDESSEHVDEVAKSVKLSIVQLYGGETIREFVGHSAVAGEQPKHTKLIEVWPVSELSSNGTVPGTGFLFTQRKSVPTYAVLLESGKGKVRGGSGQRFEWELLRPMVLHLSGMFNFVVAGGLTPQNVGKAIEILKPWGVDVVSGVEAQPGKKDPEKVRAFVRAVRELEVS
jgi:phosphoribosylanthranilate isomerase